MVPFRAAARRRKARRQLLLRRITRSTARKRIAHQGCFRALGSFNETTRSPSREKSGRRQGVDPHAKLASFYMVSGLCTVSGPGRSCTNYAGTISVFTRRYRRDSGRPALRGLARRLLPPRCARCAFSGQKTEDWLRELARMRKDSKSSLFSSPLSNAFEESTCPMRGQTAHRDCSQSLSKCASPGR